MPRHLKGAIVEWVEHDKTKRRAPIRLDKSSMTFFAREDDTDVTKEPFASKDGGDVRRWLKQRLALTTNENNIEWQPVIKVKHGGEPAHRYREMEEFNGESIEVEIDRLWMGLTRDGYEWRTLRWVQADPESPACVPENERYAVSSKHGLGPKNPRLREAGTREEAFRLPSFETRYGGSTAYLRYTPELWQGLLVIVRTIAESRKTLKDLLGTNKGIEQVAAIGAGRQQLLLNPAKKA